VFRDRVGIGLELVERVLRLFLFLFVFSVFLFVFLFVWQ